MTQFTGVSWMRFNLKKATRIFATGLTAIYFATNCVFAHSAESNFWAERKKSASRSVILRAKVPKDLSARDSSPSAQNDNGSDHQPLVVIHIQDVHRNPEAQQNIAQTIQAMINRGHVDLVALEGCSRTFDFTPFRNFKY